MNLVSLIRGGQLAGRKRTIVITVAIVTAIGGYLAGDVDLTGALGQLVQLLPALVQAGP